MPRAIEQATHLIAHAEMPPKLFADVGAALVEKKLNPLRHTTHKLVSKRVLPASIEYTALERVECDKYGCHVL